jgi:FlaA1/EpsC-like NDP-sugar epimerase
MKPQVLTRPAPLPVEESAARAKKTVRRTAAHPALRNATILITGGTGSFGNRVAARLQECGPREIRIFSRDEKKQWEMQGGFPDFRYYIGDVRDGQSLAQAVRGVDYVFHAAALKQVPSCEVFPWEAVQTNILGAQNLCRIAADAGVKSVVALSTDKAVKPVNAMGISKAMMEKIVTSQNRRDKAPVFSCVRYGNVMGSRGSVIPLFRRQIRENKPLTVTVPEMTRFLLTLDESVDLVFKAMTTARGGEVFVRRAPACTVLDLARAMVRKYSPRGVGHPIQVLGSRPGEKLHEVLVNEYEMQRAREEEGYFIVQPEYSGFRVRGRAFGEEYTSANTTQMKDEEELSALLDRVGTHESYV